MAKGLGHRGWLWAAAAAAGVCVLAGGGCGRTMIDSRLKTTYSPADLNSEMDFWHSLPGRAAVANDEALHGLIVLESGRDRNGTYEERVQHAKARKWIGEGWDEPPEVAARRGVIAAALARILEIQGGVMMHILGPVPRYALRELAYRGIMAESSEQQTITGREFLGVISKARDYMEQRRADGGPVTP